MSVDDFIWRMKQYIQYVFGDIKLVLQKKYTFKDYFFWRTKFYSCSKKTNVTFYVIRRRSGHRKLEGSQRMGLAGLALFTLGDIQYAIKKKYIPIIDFMTYSNTYLTLDEVNQYNAWDFFFESEFLMNIDELKNKGNVIISNGILKESMPSYDLLMENEPSEIELSMWKKLADKYLVLNASLKKRVNNYLKENILGDKVLGVLCRGTDYLLLHPKGHPIQPDPEVVVEKAAELMKGMCIDKIYLATEDINIYKKFKLHFGEKLLTYSIPDMKYQRGYLVDNLENDARIRKTHGENYLISISILSQCNSFIGGITSGTILALILSNGYEYIHYWRYGYYK